MTAGFWMLSEISPGVFLGARHASEGKRTSLVLQRRKGQNSLLSKTLEIKQAHKKTQLVGKDEMSGSSKMPCVSLAFCGRGRSGS